MKKRALAAISALVVFGTGCVHSGFTEDEFLVNEGISLFVNGELILSYTPETHQIGFSPDTGEIRVSDDNMADYFIFRYAGEMPSNAGDEMTADIEYTTSDNLKKLKGVSFRVTRTDEATGLIWLWNGSGKTGVVLPDIKRLE